VSDKPVDKLVGEILSDDELEQLRQLFGVTAAEWPAALDGLVQAAIAEYADAFLGSGQTMSQASYIQQQRLLQLLQRGAFQRRLPTAEQLARLFHLNGPTAARTLLRNVMARFDAELTATRNAALADVLRGAKRSRADVVTVYISDSSVSEALQKMVDIANVRGAKPFPLERISRVGSVAGQWRIPFDSYTFLCDQLNVPLADRPDD